MAAELTLQRVGTKPSAGAYLRAIWDRRQFAVAVAVNEARAQHMNTALGNLWHLLNPILRVSVYFLIFGLILNVTRGVDNVIGFLAVGVFMYHYTRQSVIAGSKSILGNEGLIRSIYFPRAVLTIATVLSHGVTFLPALAVMLLVAVLTGESVTVKWLVLPFVLIVQTAFNIGLALIAARLTHRFPDVQNLLGFMFRIVFYFSAILFLPTRWVDESHLWLFNYNPVYAIIFIARGLVLGGMEGDTQPLLWVSALLWSAAVLPIGFFYFRNGEQEYGRG